MRSLSNKSGRLLIVLVIALPILAILVIFIAGTGTAKRQVPAENRLTMTNPVSADQAKIDADLQQWLSTNTDCFNTPNEAAAALNGRQKDIKNKIDFVSKMPDAALAGGGPKGIYVANKKHMYSCTATPELMNSTDIVRIYYNNGICLSLGFLVDGYPIDYDLAVATANQPDSAEHTGLPHIVTIHGFKGRGQEPGYDYIKAFDTKNVRGAYLEWSDNNARYSLRAPRTDQTTPLSRLIEIAESMYE